MSDALVTVRGRVVKLFYQTAAYCAGKIVTDARETISFGGKVFVTERQDVTLRGRWVDHPKYGRQFQPTTQVYDAPIDVTGLTAWLAGLPAAVGIGPARASLIAKEYGADFPRILAEDPEQIAVLAQVPLDNVLALREHWCRHEEKMSACTWLAGIGLTQTQCEALWARFQGSIVPLLEEDPYLLLREVPGMGWRTVDAIARKMGLAADHPGRIAAALTTALFRAADDDGSTAVAPIDLADRAGGLLALDTPDAAKIILLRLADLVEAGEQVGAVDRQGKMLCALPWLLAAEQTIARYAARAAEPNPAVAPDDSDDRPDADPGAVIEDLIGAAGLDESQAAAVRKAFTYRLTVVTGEAGAGKTTIIKTIRAVCDALDLPCYLAAPTGKAARRLEELVPGAHAQTIHRLLGYSGTGFTHGRGNPIAARCVVVDECFPYKQPVLTESGWEYIGKIVEQKLPVRVYSRDPTTGRLELKRVTRWLKKPRPNTLVKIVASRSGSSRSARVVRCTSEHKILTPSGYRAAGSLSPGDRVIVRGRALSAHQRSVVVGSLFGDGSLSRGKSRNSPQFTFMNGEAQKSYLEYKRAVFGDLAGSMSEAPSGYEGGRPVHRFNIQALDELLDLRDMMVPNGKHGSGRQRWSPTDDLLALVDEVALAFWFADNGSVRKRRGQKSYALLHTERFSYEANVRIAAYIQSRFGVVPRIQNAGRGLFLLRFRVGDSRALFDIIRPHVPECMSGKVPGAFGCLPTLPEPSDTCEAVVRSVAVEASSGNYHSVYDIEVADHHNYVAGNIVVSNCSMVDVPLFASLVSALPDDCALVLVGDDHQLPPVGPGAVLRDLIHKELAPVARLAHCHRQAGPLKQNSSAVLLGRVAPTVTADPGGPWYVQDRLSRPEDVVKVVERLVTQILTDSFGLDPVNDVQIITGMHKGPVGTRALNGLLQRLHQRKLGVDLPEPDPEKPFALRVGDKVIQTRNNYELGVMNGHVGIVTNDSPLTVKFDDRLVQIPNDCKGDIELGYCLTTHKMQGSQVPCAVVICHRSQQIMHHRSWLYTAVTRASRTCIILGDQFGIEQAAGRVVLNTRKTLLPMLCETNE